VPGDLEQPLAEEEHHPGIVRRAELPAMASRAGHGRSGGCVVAADVVLRVQRIPGPGDHVNAEALRWRIGGSSIGLASPKIG
jgi:hypothetical protein